MKISVIVPTYKPQAYLLECLDSIYSQTFSKNEYELLLVLNGCNEPYNTQIHKWLSQHKDLHVHYIQTDEGGVSNARNIALDKAKGEYVTFIDDDDIISPLYLKELYYAATPDMVSLCYPYAFNDGEINRQLPYGITEAYDYCINNNCRKLSSRVRKFFSGPWMKLIPMSFIQGRRFDVRFKNGEDSLFMFLISDKIHKVSFASRNAIYYRRFRNNSATTSERRFCDVALNQMKMIVQYTKFYLRSPINYNFMFFLTRVMGAIRSIYSFKSSRLPLIKNNMNWNKYLSSERLRKSTTSVERRREKNDYRTDIECDFGRVIFSSACRRLHDKTQVFPLTTDDNIHSRLTHSMEVMNIGQSFIFALSQSEEFKRHTGLDEVTILRDLAAALKVACLVHDIGNPPFGHFGEDSLQNYFKTLLANPPEWMSKDDKKAIDEFAKEKAALDYTQFDGNAEGLRVLTKLQFIDSLDGLNLTCASLGAFMKYPNVNDKNKNEQVYIGIHKHGVLTTEENVLQKVVEACDLPIENNVVARHPLSFLMEASDSICYLIMDIEDGLKKRWLTVGDVCGDIVSYGESKGITFNEAANELISVIEKDLQEKKDKKLNERGLVMNLRTHLMEYLVNLALGNFIGNIESIENGTYNKELIDDDSNDIAGALNDICKKRILSNREIISLEITGRAVIKGILDAYIEMFFSDDSQLRNRAKQLVSRTIFLTTLQEHLESVGSNGKADDEYEGFDIKEFTVEERLRILRDYVSCMTDKFALNHYRKLSGQKIY